MNRDERQQVFSKILKDASCPEQLAEEASAIAIKYYPLGLSGATDEEITTVKKAQKYLDEQ